MIETSLLTTFELLGFAVAMVLAASETASNRIERRIAFLSFPDPVPSSLWCQVVKEVHPCLNNSTEVSQPRTCTNEQICVFLTNVTKS